MHEPRPLRTSTGPLLAPVLPLPLPDDTRAHLAPTLPARSLPEPSHPFRTLSGTHYTRRCCARLWRRCHCCCQGDVRAGCTTCAAVHASSTRLPCTAAGQQPKTILRDLKFRTRGPCNAAGQREKKRHSSLQAAHRHGGMFFLSSRDCALVFGGNFFVKKNMQKTPRKRAHSTHVQFALNIKCKLDVSAVRCFFRGFLHLFF